MVNCPNLLVGALDNLGCACLCSNCAISAKYKSAFGMRNVNTTSVTKTFFCFNYNFIDTIERSVAILQSTFFYAYRSEEHTSELQSRENLVCRLLLEKKK